MRVLNARNVCQALPAGLQIIHSEGHEQNSRNGPVRLIDGPYCTVITNPTERVLFDPVRDANPFFHFMEGLWMLAGRNDVEFVSQFNSKIGDYSDDGATFHGAYGFRWRHKFMKDQIEEIVRILRENPDDRRCVLQMWDAWSDLGQTGLDFPCNLLITFRISQERNALDMMVHNRSNDVVWGAYGANAVHMSMLQEYVAGKIGIQVGAYWTVSMNTHLYMDMAAKYLPIKDRTVDDRYSNSTVVPKPMMTDDVDDFDYDLISFCDGCTENLKTQFFKTVVLPIWFSWKAFKNKTSPTRHDDAFELLDTCAAPDWRMACQEWIERRANK